jgi:UDP-N-acetylmuramoyl-L-alanyl-D-glutamate--2,6-diaminopimelate ligase
MTMPAPTLSELLAGIAVPPSALASLRPAGLRLDSRAVEPGEGFVALAGHSRHGLDFAGQALARGASCVLYESPAPDAFADSLSRLPAVGISELPRHLGVIADRAARSPSRQLTTIGVTGTNGKTSTVHMLAQAFAGAGIDVATIGTLGAGRPGALEAGERTTPDVFSVHALLRRFVDDGVTHVAMEVSSHALDQGRVDQVAFAIAIFTNLTRDHLDYHGDMTRYGAAKAKLFTWSGLSAAVINIDDPFGRELLAKVPAGVRILTCASDDARATFRARSIHTGFDGLSFILATPDGEREVRSQLLGRFNVANLLGVAATLHALDWPVVRITKALESLQSVPGRMNRHGGGDRPLVVVDYAHTPDALEQALVSLRDHVEGNLYCVFGCGGERDVGKRPQMAAIAEKFADGVIVTDDNPRGENGDAIVADIVAGFAQPDAVEVQRDRATAIRRAIARARRGDIVLVAGKGHESYQEIDGRKLPFDDGKQVAIALEAWTC